MFSFAAPKRVGGRPLAVAGAAAAIGAVAAGIAVADAGSPPAAGYVSVSPAVKIFGGSLATGKSVSVVAIGGSSTVPTNATAVQLSVTVSAAGSGAINIAPAGDPTAGGATSVFYSGSTTQTVHETVGTKDQITFHNSGSGTATVTVKVTGYSTQLAASNIAPDGGSAGQVLTNTGTGAAWRTTGSVLSMARFSISGAGTNTSASWQFMGSPVLEHFADGNTAAEVTATTDLASTNGNTVFGYFGICYEQQGSTVVNASDFLYPYFTAPAFSYFAQTETSVIGNLAAGEYYVGPCTQGEAANNLHGFGNVSVIVAETANGVTSFARTKAQSQAQPNR
jgi:hypothetical protein